MMVRTRSSTVSSSAMSSYYTGSSSYDSEVSSAMNGNSMNNNARMVKTERQYSELPSETPAPQLLLGVPSKRYQKKKRGCAGCNDVAINPYDIEKRSKGC